MAKPTPTKGAKSAKNAKPARSAKPAVTAKSVKAKPGASGKAALAAKAAPKKAVGVKAPAAAAKKGPSKDAARKGSTPVKTQKTAPSSAKAETKKAIMKADATRKAARAAATRAAAGKQLSVKTKAEATKSVVKAGKAADVAPSRSAAAVSKNGKAPVEAPAPVTSSGRTFIPTVSRPLGTYGGVLLAENPKPFPKKTPYTKAELNKLMEAMLEERTSLRRELGRMENAAMGADGGQENQGHSLHIAEHASDLQATENLLGVREMNEERLAQIEEALLKLRETQTYGLCVACGSKIGIERLIAKPHAHLCMECRVKFEKRRPRG